MKGNDLAAFIGRDNSVWSHFDDSFQFVQCELIAAERMLYQIQTRILKLSCIRRASTEYQKLRGCRRGRCRHVEVQIREFLQFLKDLRRRREYGRHPPELILVLMICREAGAGFFGELGIGAEGGQLGRWTVSVRPVGEDGELVMAVAGLHRHGGPPAAGPDDRSVDDCFAFLRRVRHVVEQEVLAGSALDARTVTGRFPPSKFNKNVS